jgi:hypothetical protein
MTVDDVGTSGEEGKTVRRGRRGRRIKVAGRQVQGGTIGTESSTGADDDVGTSGEEGKTGKRGRRGRRIKVAGRQVRGGDKKNWIKNRSGWRRWCKRGRR